MSFLHTLKTSYKGLQKIYIYKKALKKLMNLKISPKV